MIQRPCESFNCRFFHFVLGLTKAQSLIFRISQMRRAPEQPRPLLQALVVSNHSLAKGVPCTKKQILHPKSDAPTSLLLGLAPFTMTFAYLIGVLFFCARAMATHFEPCSNVGIDPFKGHNFVRLCSSGRDEGYTADLAAYTCRAASFSAEVANYGVLAHRTLEFGE